MLIELDCPDDCLRHWVGRSLPRRVMAHWLQQGAAPEEAQPRWFTDNPAGPRIIMRLHGPACTVHGAPESVAAALAELRAGRLKVLADWPGPEALVAWDRAGRRELHLIRVLPSTLWAAIAAGFTPAPEREQPYYCANAWYVLGEPRFAAQVVHPARIVNGSELLALMLDADERDEHPYIRACLEAGPSCVVELEGQAVSWSLTHLGGAIGRIYTPPQFRGRGYGKSLTARHVDELLRLRGIAVASVRVDNVASYRMFQALGARHLRGPMTWSTLLWD